MLRLKVQFCVIVCFLGMVPAFLYAQTAVEMDAIMETAVVTCAQAARFVYASSEGAVSAVEQLPKGSSPDDPITLDELSFMIMKAFNMKGGIMYTIFPSRRYAFRTMVGRSLIQGAADPAMTLSGERFLQILGNVLTAVGEEP